MRIEYKSRKLEKQCTDAPTAVRDFGQRNAGRIKQRMQELKHAPSIQTLLISRIGRCHPLKGDREGQYAMDLSGGLRLIFRDSGYEGVEVQAVEIIEIGDYH